MITSNYIFILRMAIALRFIIIEFVLTKWFILCIFSKMGIFRNNIRCIEYELLFYNHLINILLTSIFFNYTTFRLQILVTSIFYPCQLMINETRNTGLISWGKGKGVIKSSLVNSDRGPIYLWIKEAITENVPLGDWQTFL